MNRQLQKEKKPIANTFALNIYDLIFSSTLFWVNSMKYFVRKSDVQYKMMLSLVQHCIRITHEWTCLQTKQTHLVFDFWPFELHNFSRKFCNICKANICSFQDESAYLSVIHMSISCSKWPANWDRTCPTRPFSSPIHWTHTRSPSSRCT